MVLAPGGLARALCWPQDGKGGTGLARQDLTWSLGGLVLGLLIATNNVLQGRFDGSSFALGQLAGNVLGGMLAAFVIGRIAARFAR